ncbi:hypothetical protein [Halobacteriovorax sp. JY17]|uniref:hypothetical protein n=1 Tax=Halobacteriovorax sp. JY17 TaxID=2014617 RepID=UPI000C5378FE|nr:hypothetical protein [Halobacteriovorax sp. JY17]PIK14702.1 MAG: hypothetical protein CES88_10210 [Halobacteriovorax sp. JY17]
MIVKNKKIEVTYVLLVSILLFLPYYINLDLEIKKDWDLCNSWSLLLKSIVLEYKTFPFIDPWTGGGSSLLSNPNLWFFSPNFLLNLILPINLSNIISLNIMTILGYFAAKKYFYSKGVKGDVLCLVSTLFISCSWFGLHFAEGHVPFRGFLLFPLVLYYLENLNPRNFFFLSLLEAFFFLDGGMYPFIFSIVITGLYVIFGIVNLKETLNLFKKNIQLVIYSFISFFLLVSPKLVPMLIDFGDREPHFIRPMMTLKDIMKSYFWPLQVISDPVEKSWMLFHEFGSYIGILSLIIILVSYLKNKKIIVLNKRFLLLGFLLVLMGTGAFKDGNPYTLLELIPLINNAHVPTRYLVILMIFYFWLLGFFLQKISLKKVRYFLMAILLLESIFVRSYTTIKAFEMESTEARINKLITKTGLNKTIEYGYKPDIYYMKNTSSKDYYDPAKQEKFIYSNQDGAYFGGIKKNKDQGQVEIIKYVPNQIVFKYQGLNSDKVTINANFSKYWSIRNSDQELRESNGLLSVENISGTGFVILEYSQRYIYFLISLYFLGLFLYLKEIFYYKRKI